MTQAAAHLSLQPCALTAKAMCYTRVQVTRQACNEGDLVPLSDFGSQGAPIHYKAWVCTNPDCGFNIKIRNGDVYLNEPINSGEAYASRR